MASDENLRGSESLNHLSTPNANDPAGSRISMKCDPATLSPSRVGGSIRPEGGTAHDPADIGARGAATARKQAARCHAAGEPLSPSPRYRRRAMCRIPVARHGPAYTFTPSRGGTVLFNSTARDYSDESPATYRVVTAHTRAARLAGRQ
jgi:hypothetical protein